MATSYCLETCNELARRFGLCGLHRPMRVGRHENGIELTYDVRGVWPQRPATVTLVVDKFVGGGFAGQVYRVVVRSIDAPQGPIDGLEVGKTYAMKILVPPSSSSLRFRNLIYGIGFQGPFALQCLPAAARAGALWQKFIRRASALHFGTDRSVVDIVATLVDHRLGSCGEISEWVDGRVWSFEVNDRLDDRIRWARGADVPQSHLRSPEYRAKRKFMADFVKLLHEMGAHEFARQYEWSTCKSQPNVLKRRDAEGDPAAGLTAVDFRAGLALLPFLPMSPGDFKLIGKGVGRGSLVQFDRGDLDKLERFIDAHGEHFADMREALDELKACEREYRRSLPDITHNHVRLLYDGELWRQIGAGSITGWHTRNITDDSITRRLRASRPKAMLFATLGPLGALSKVAALLIGLRALGRWEISALEIALLVVLGVVVPAATRLTRKLWGRGDYRRHFGSMIGHLGYLRRAIRGRAAEMMIDWHRAGRVSSERAMRLAAHPWRITGHLPLSVLPPGLHRFLSDGPFAWGKLRYIVTRPIKLYFDPAEREAWLRSMLAEGLDKGMLTADEARRIEDQIGEPFIQKYLKALAVHVCTLPITQVVSVMLALWYVGSHMDFSNAAGLSDYWSEISRAFGAHWAGGLTILALFQVTPISPGSLARGLYVVYLAIRDRSVREYNIAIFLGFFKYVGYLAFPIQMAYRYPALARFMAGHWATGAVGVVPVFGEHGALMEHGIFDLFYNRPLTIRRRMGIRAARRQKLAPRAWHVLPAVLLGAAIVAGTDLLIARSSGDWPTGVESWYLRIWGPLIVGAICALWAGGASTARRLKLALAAGVVIALAEFAARLAVAGAGITDTGVLPVAMMLMWLLFQAVIAALLAAAGAGLAEILALGPDEPPGQLPVQLDSQAEPAFAGESDAGSGTAD